jgi:hypothetical protein
MAYFEIGYIERYCKKYNKTEWDDFENLNCKGVDCFMHCPMFPGFSYYCDEVSELIQYKGFNLKKYDIYKNDDSSYEPNLLMLVTSTRNYICFYLKIDGDTLIDLRDDYKEVKSDE